MTFSRHCKSSCIALVSTAFLTSCTPVYNQKFGMSFLPPSPHQATMPVYEPVKLETNLYLADTSSLPNLRPTFEVAPRPTQIDARIRRAEERFQEGKRLYQSGNTDGARAEFDRAIDGLLNAPENAPDRYKIPAKLDELVSAIHRYDVNGLGAGDLSGQLGFDKAPLEDILETTFPVDPNLKPKVKEQLLATQSQLPLQLTDAVLSYINYFSGDRGHRTLVAGLKRAGRYKPLIQRILSEERVPQELIYLAQAESGFLPRAMSNKAAVGMWQFVQWRGRQYGLMQTAFHDDRMDPEKATRASARHLRDLYEHFGDWYLAIAAYNCGDACVDKAVQRTGFADFWELRNRGAIPKETTNYVPIIVAMTIMHKNAKDYNLEGLELDAPVEFESFTVTSPTHLALVADSVDRPVSELRELNPALLTNIAPTNYQVHVPAGTRTMALARLETIPAERRASWRIHRVTAGDTLASIAKRYNTSSSSIANLNPSSETEIGNVLVIPTASEMARASVATKRGKKGVAVRQVAVRSTSARSHVKAVKTVKAAKRQTGKPVQRRAHAGVQTASL